MTVFIVRRVLQAIVVLLIVTLITFALLRAIPGNVAVAILGPGAYRNPAAIKQFDSTYGFDKPWYSQYLLWLSHLLQGNLGLLLEAQPERRLAARPAAAQDDLPGRHLHHPGPDHRHADRRDPGGAAQQVPRPLLQRHLDRLLRDALVPARYRC